MELADPSWGVVQKSGRTSPERGCNPLPCVAWEWGRVGNPTSSWGIARVWGAARRGLGRDRGSLS